MWVSRYRYFKLGFHSSITSECILPIYPNIYLTEKILLDIFLSRGPKSVHISTRLYTSILAAAKAEFTYKMCALFRHLKWTSIIVTL